MLLVQADARRLPFADASVQCCITSPPYFGLRDYGTARWEGGDPACDHTTTRRGHKDEKQATSAGTSRDSLAGLTECRLCGATRIDSQIGLEPTIDAYVAQLVTVFREVWRVLKPDGVCWLVIGDSYSGGGGFSPAAPSNLAGSKQTTQKSREYKGRQPTYGLKPKDLCMIPARVALALQADGWWLRSEIVWAKKNCMPESVTDRPTRSHEMIYLLAKSSSYYFDADAVREPLAYPEDAIRNRGRIGVKHEIAVGGGLIERKSMVIDMTAGRNIRSVWHIATQPYSGARSLADYVGADGKPYKRSADCPVHGHRRGTGTTRTGECDAPQDQVLIGSAGISSHPDQVLDVGYAAIPSRDGVSHTLCDSSDGRIGGSTLGSRTCASDRAETQNQPNTVDTGGTIGDTQDSLGLACERTATGHNSETHRTDHVLLTTAPCIVCAETSIHTDDKQGSLDLSVQCHHMRESSTLEDSVSHGPAIVTSRTQSRTEHTSRCNCTIVTVDHFATFPEKLVERCILAGSRPGDVVLDPFMGSGTVARVALRLGRRAIGCDLNTQYLQLADDRTRVTYGLPLENEGEVVA